MATRPLIVIVALAALAGFASVTGCSSSSDSPTGPTADQSCTDIATLYCSKIDSCSPLLDQIAYNDVASCKTTFKAQCLLGLAAPSTGATPTTEAACTTAASSVTCTDLYADVTPTECLPVAGTLADGAACGDDSQCVSKYCGTSETLACGKCGVAPVAGSSCATEKCGHGLKCSAANLCVVPGVIDATCDANNPCRIEMSCTDGKCTAAAETEGAACDFNGKGAPQCDLTQGLVCDPVGKKCLKVKVVGVGAPCGYDGTAATVSVCENEGVCQKAKPTDPAGTCIAGVGAGQACNNDDNVGPKCLSPGKCVAGTCVSPDPSTCK